MIAPQPIFSPRGTPISIVNRIRALTALGHQVDLVTYPLGENVDIAGLRILRAPRIPGIHSVKIGPSAAKLPLDAAVFVRTVTQLFRRRYDVIHTNEEAGVFGWLLHRIARAKHVYEMHSDLAVVMVNYGLSERHPLTRFAGWLEKRMLRSADSVVVHFPDLLARVQARAPGRPAEYVADISIEKAPDADEVARLRSQLAPDGESLVVYTGTLEPYQGMPLLIDAMPHVVAAVASARLIVVGGRDDQIADLRARAAGLGIDARITFVGLRSPEEIPSYLAVANVLVSPRDRGNNAPLKLLSYMHSGRPMVLTNIPSHTQLVNDSMATLVDPTPEGLAAGIVSVLNAPDSARDRAERARAFAADRFSLQSFVASTASAYSHLGAAATPGDLAAAAARIEAAA